MGGLDLPVHLIGIHVEAIEIGAHGLQRILGLQDSRCHVQGFAGTARCTFNYM